MRTFCKLFILFFILSWEAFSQGVTNNANLFIAAGTTLAVEGDFVNNEKVTNNGSLFISGAWINNKTYDAGSGTFVLSSPNDQIVNHNEQSFTNLRIAGGGRKLFLANLTIEESLSLDDGILVAENDSKLIIADGATIQGGSANSYLVGPLQRNGEGDLFFPIGSATEYLPATLRQTEGDEPQITMRAYSNSFPFASLQNVAIIDTSRFWEMETSNYEGAFLELEIPNDNDFDNIDDLVIIAAEDSVSETINLGQFEQSGTLNNGAITSEEQALFRFYTLGALGNSERNTEITVFNVITPNGDGRHDFLNIENISEFPNNVVTIYSRWGNQIYRTSGYNNNDIVFTGIDDNGAQLKTGNYHYVIDKGNGDKPIAGYLFIQR